MKHQYDVKCKCEVCLKKKAKISVLISWELTKSMSFDLGSE